MINYCLPILLSDQKQIECTIESNLNRHQFFEIWVDYVENFELDWLLNVIKKYPNRILVLFRRLNLDPINIDIDFRKQILESLDSQPCFVDIDFKTQMDEMEFLDSAHLNLNLILSYHNYTFTPSMEDLRTIIKDMLKQRPKICKIASFCEAKKDALRLLELRLELSEQGTDAIILGMGQHGIITRIFGTIWGNAMIFAPNSFIEDGQVKLSRDNLGIIFDELGKFYGR